MIASESPRRPVGICPVLSNFRCVVPMPPALVVESSIVIGTNEENHPCADYPPSLQCAASFNRVGKRQQQGEIIKAFVALMAK